MTLERVQDEQGMERWEEPNHTVVEFRAPDKSRVRFTAYRRSQLFVRTKIGAEIETWGHDFTRARIDSRYFVQAQAQVYQAYTDSDSDKNDDYLDEYEQKIMMGSLPSRVESLCRVQWHDVRLSGVVSFGDEVFSLQPVPPFPAGWPEDWPPLPVEGYVTINPRTLELTARRVGVTVRGDVVVTAHETAQTVRVSGAPSPRFEVTNDGGFKVQPGQPHRVGVTFSPSRDVQEEGEFTVQTDKGDVRVKLVGKVANQPEVAADVVREGRRVSPNDTQTSRP